MIIGKKWLYILLGTFFTIVIVINLVFWLTQPYVASGYETQPDTFISFQTFFNLISTFPGPVMSLELLNSWANVFTNFDITGIGPIDVLIAIFRLLTGPIVVSVGAIGDIIMNLIWIFKLIFVDSGTASNGRTGSLYSFYH